MSAQSRVTSRCDAAHCGREELHHFLPLSLARFAPSIYYYDSVSDSMLC